MKNQSNEALHTRAYNIEAVGRLIDTLDRLRVECPWDRKQTFESLRPNTIEEVYELCEALIDSDMPNVKKELGDVLLHVLFYAKIASEQGAFDIGDVADALNAKLIFRHPHVFGTVDVAGDAHQVEQNWEQIKLKEKDGNRSVLAGVPRSLPALIKAYRMQEKAANVGFDWPDKAGVWQKLKEEIAEFEREAERKEAAAMEAEFGDVMFSLINVARFYGINPENALEHTNRKFLRRFGYIESQLSAEGKKISEVDLEEMDRLWNEAKSQE